MTSKAAMLAEVLNRSAKALAAYAAGELLAAEPKAAEGFGADPHAGWSSVLRGRLDELAAAASFEQPSVFAGQMSWARAVLLARGIRVDVIRQAFEHLGRVLAEELPEQVQPLALDYFERGMRALDQPSDDVTTSLLANTHDGRLAAAYLLAVLEGNRVKAGRIVLDAAARGHDVRRLYLDVLLPAQAEVGRMWAAGEINVAEEHFASDTTKAVMAQLRQLAPAAAENGRTFLAAAVMGNFHDVGVHAVADFFEMAGWRTIQLGANVPTEDLIQAVEFFRTDLLGLSVSLSTQLPALRETVRALRRSSLGNRLKIIIGGRALAENAALARQVGADAFAVDPQQAVEIGSRLVEDDRSRAAEAN